MSDEKAGSIAAVEKRTDPELLAQFVSRRDEEAFRAMVLRHGPLVMRVCRTVLRHTQDAEDAYQRTFIILANSAGTIRRPVLLPSWLQGVAYRVAMRHLSLRVRRSSNSDLELQMIEDKTLHEVTARDDEWILHEELSELPERYRAPIILCYLEGKTRSEAARTLECTESAVKGRLENARRELRRRLLRRGWAFGSLSAISCSATLQEPVSAAVVSETVQTALSNAPHGTATDAGRGAEASRTNLAQYAVACSVALILLVACGLQNAGQPSVRGQRIAPLEMDSRALLMPETVMVSLKMLAEDEENGDAIRAARNINGARNLRRVVVATHWYYDAHRAFPAGYSADSNGRALLSWRVHVLPFLGEGALYDKFHLDEPWDSVHNKRLISQIPTVYRAAKSDNQSGKTRLLGVSGADGMFVRPQNGDRQGINIQQVRDGTSNTIMLIEAPDEMSIVWTKPGDFAPTAKSLNSLAEQKGGVRAVMGDSCVRFLPAPIDQQKLRAMFTKSSWEAIELPGEVLIRSSDDI